MKYCRSLWSIGVLFSALTASAQGEEMRALAARPATGLVQPKTDGVDRIFIYQYETQELPLMDDFSIDRTRKRNAQVTDAGVTLDQTVYRLEVGGVSTWDMQYSTDTTFRFVIDGSEPPVVTREALPSVLVTVRDLSVYPPSSAVVEAWPDYNIRDSITAPPPDTLYLASPQLTQDSLLVYGVAPAGGAYTMNDVETPLILWQDDDVYINGTYGVEPPTLGVATFDGLSRTGYPYNFPNYTAYGRADKLTSVPIDLEYQVSDSIYLSFFYQAKGLSGDSIPQVGDSLLLEFYAPLEASWYRVWGIPYVDQAPFQQILVPVTQERFLKNGFQFRFVNYATLSGSFDHWHLDYVRLGRQRAFNDTRIVDVAWVYPEASLLQTYTSIPFDQFASAPASLMALQVAEKLRNLDINDRLIEYRMSAQNLDGGPFTEFVNGLSPNGNAASILDTQHPINSAPNNFVYDNTPSTDAAFWDVRFRAIVSPDINPYNDTMRFQQEFSNYYSYDDGSAEAGYGLNIGGARLAYRYDLIGPDTLRAIRMYFNPIANQPPNLPPDEGSFFLTIWSSVTPEVVLYRNFSFSSPQYRLDGIDKFVEYPLDEPLPVEGTIYIGWTQTNAASMNIGFDRNRNNRTKIFYNVGNGFVNTSFRGSLMMRPVMVAEVDPWAAVDEVETEDRLLLWPNPAGDIVNLTLAQEAPAGTVWECLDATGRVVSNGSIVLSTQMNSAALSSGFYTVRVMNPTGSFMSRAPLVIRH